jgi:hypothetical protein
LHAQVDRLNLLGLEWEPTAGDLAWHGRLHQLRRFKALKVGDPSGKE